MAVTPTTQQTAPPVVASPPASNGRFSQNNLLIAGVVSTVASIALAIFEMIAWTTAASVVASLAVCYAISYLLPEPGTVPAATPAAANNPPPVPNAPPTVITPRTPLRGVPENSISQIMQRACRTPQRLDASLHQFPVQESDDHSDDDLFVDDTPNTAAAANTSQQISHLDTTEQSLTHSPIVGRTTPPLNSSTQVAPSTPTHLVHARTTVEGLNTGFPSPMAPLQPTDHTLWRRDILVLYRGYVELIRRVEEFLAPGAAATPVQNSGDRQQAAGVLKTALQEKQREILRKLAEKRTFIPGADYRRYKGYLEVDVPQLCLRLDQA